MPVSAITVSSTLNSSYGKENIQGLSDTPWVGGGIAHSSNWLHLDWKEPILLKHLNVDGGYVDLYRNGTEVKCYVTRFTFSYKNVTGNWVDLPV